MRTQDAAINTVFGVLTDENNVTCPVYKYTKPTATTPDEFIVLNALPIDANVMQTVIVNVNYYVKDIGDGLPDIEVLECRTADLMDLLTETEGDLYMIDFVSQEYHRQAQINYHYSNIRLSVKLINE